MNRFIQQAEQKIYNAVQLPSLRKNVTGVTAPSNKYLSCPDDYLASFSLAVIENYGQATETYYYLLNKDVNFIREAYPMPNDTGLPLYYSLFGARVTSGITSNELTFLLGPTPDAIYRMELHYYYYPESIVTALTTWLGDNFDSALLYGTLAEAGTYMKSAPEDGMYKLYQERYVQAIALYKNLADGKQRGDAYRDGQVRVAVS
jgi:hypothetical protein